MATAPISDGETRNSYTASAAQVTFPYTFWIKDEDHLDVYVNDTLKALTTDYTVSAVQAVSGANVVFNSGLADGDVVVIEYTPEIERLTEFSTSGSLRASALNLELTYLTSINQYLTTQTSRTLKLAASDTSTVATLPSPTASTVLGWNASANALVNYTFSSIPGDLDVVTSNIAAGHYLVYDGTRWINQKNNFIATSAPTVNDDSSANYVVGSRWIDINNDESYICLDATAGAAVWVNSSVTSDDLGSLAVKNEVAISDLADGTDGELITWDASGNPATVSAGTSGHVLTSNGAGAAPTFQAVTTPTLLTFTNETEFAIDLSGTNKAYQLFVLLKAGTDNVGIRMRFSSDGGVTPLASAYRHSGNGRDDNTDAQFNGSASALFMPLTNGDNLGSASGEQLNALINVFPKGSTDGIDASVFYSGSYANTSGQTQDISGQGRYTGTQADMDYIEILPSSGNITGYVILTPIG